MRCPQCQYNEAKIKILTRIINELIDIIKRIKRLL